MEKYKYVYKPAAGPPTVKKLQKVTLMFMGVMTIGCLGVAIFGKPTTMELLFLFGVWIVLLAFVIAARYSILYISEVQIDGLAGVLYVSYLNHKGEIKMSAIDIKQAQYSFVRRDTRGYQGYILTLKDKNARVQMDEKQSQNKRQTNTFAGDQLEEMNRIILQIKNGKLDADG